MVKKLLKHEFIYYFRTFSLFLPIVLVIAAMTRVFRLFENSDSVIASIAVGSSALMLFVACWALLILSVIVAVVRFYKNMYSAEGYLTFTLPVKHSEHIFVKLFTAICCEAICLLTVIIAALIALSGKPLSELMLVLATGLSDIYEELGTVNSIIAVIEIILMMIVSVVNGMLLYYACITVGQTAKKNRILMAVGAYFVYYIATQIISTVFVMIVIVLGMTGIFDSIAAWLDNNVTAAIHLSFGTSIVIYSALSAAFWFVTQSIMTKKLNLE